MNVIVSNKYSAMLQSLSNRIDLIKMIDGEFTVDSLIAQFQNFFFNKMILDITAISGYQDITQIQRLSFGLDVSKIILLLDDSPIVNSDEYKSELVSIGIYNFTKNIDAIPYLIDNPNSYKDVAPFHMLGNSGFQGNQQRGGQFITQNIPVAPTMNGTRVIGIKNLTQHAGATTLIYMLKKQLSEYYTVLGLELDKDDFKYFNDSDLRSIASQELQSVISNPMTNYNVILIDINNSPEEANCTEMLYLVEPTTIMLNRMVNDDRSLLDRLRSLKIILNKSLLDANDIRDFENEAGCSVFHNIQPLDDKKDRHRVLDELLAKLGFDRNAPAQDTNKSARLFGIVKE